MNDRRIWIIFLILFVNLLGFGIILPLLPYYVESFGAGALTIGLLSSVYSLFQFIGAPILGELSDKFGRRPILLVSIGGTAVSFLLMGMAKTLPMLFLARILDGVSGGNISTAQAYLADITKKSQRTQSMSILAAAIGLGFVLGPVMGGVLSRYGYAAPSIAAGLLALMATVLTYFLLPESHKVAAKPTLYLTKNLTHKNITRKLKKIINIDDFKYALNRPTIGLLLTISFIAMFVLSLLQGTFALFTEHTLGFTVETTSFLFAYIGMVGILVQLFLIKPILVRLPEHILVILSILGLSVSIGLLTFSTHISILILATTLFTLASSIASPVVTGMISKATSEDDQGNIAGVTQSVGSLARLFGPLLGTYFYSFWGVSSPYVISSFILFVTFLYTAKNLKKKAYSTF